MVVVLAGDCAVEIDGGRQTQLKPFDAVHVEAGRWHRFRNLGTTPFTILAIYDNEIVERTLRESGTTTRD
jgi:mannose-6-phosphate isomerase-like protein (cupin superfamily)